MSSLTTKKAIAYSLKELLLEKPLSKITINDITERCDINRQTFYYHFSDIVDLVEWISIEDADKALKNKNNYANWQEGFLEIFKLLEKDKIFISNIYHSVPIEIITKYLHKLVYPVIYKVVDEKSEGGHAREEDKEFVTKFYMYAFVQIVLEWVKNDMKDDPKKIVDKVATIVEGTIEKAVLNIK